MNEEVKKKRKEIVLAWAKIKSGREKNLKLAKKLRRELAQMLTKKEGEKTE